MYIISLNKHKVNQSEEAKRLRWYTVTNYEVRICVREHYRHVVGATRAGYKRGCECTVYLLCGVGHDRRAVLDGLPGYAAMSRIVDVTRVFIRIAVAYRQHPGSWLVTMFQGAQELGGVYIKFLQQLAGIELASEQFSVYRGHLKVFDEVDVEPLDIHAVLARELGTQIREVELISDVPLATGSFAQVYKARLTSSGQEVVVKVLRPSLQKSLKTDLKLLRVIARFVQPFMKSGLVDLRAMAKEFERSSRQETDYEREVAMGQYLYEYFSKRTTQLVIPKTYAQLSTRTLLVQDFVPGLPLSRVIQVAHAGQDSYEYVQKHTGSSLHEQLATVGSEFLTSILQADYVMADPHPGNILLLPDNKVALIDFGLVTKAPLHRSAFFGMISQYRALYEDRVDMGSLAIAMMAFYDYELYEALTTVRSHGNFTDGLGHYITNNVATPEVLSGRLARKRMITQLFLQELNVGNRFAIRMDERDAILQKAMHNFLSTARLAAGEQYRETRYFAMMHTALVRTEDEAYKTGVRETMSRPAPMSLEKAQEIVVDWLSVVAERDRAAYQTLMKGGVA